MAASLLAMLDRREPGEEPTAEGGIELLERAAVPDLELSAGPPPPHDNTAPALKVKKGAL